MSISYLLAFLLLAICAGLLLGLAFARIRRGRAPASETLARQVVLDGVRDGVIAVDPAGRIVEYNRAAAELASIGASAIGRPLVEAMANRALAATVEGLRRGDGPPAERAADCPSAQARPLRITRAPLADGRGKPIGELFVLRDVAEQTRAEQVLARQAADLTTLHHVASAVGSTLGVRELLATIVTTTREALGMAHATVGLIDAERRVMTITAESDDAGGASAVGTAISLRGPFEELWRAGAPIAIEDVLADDRLIPLRDLLTRRSTRALLVVPLRSNDRLIGTLNLASAVPCRFDEEELALAQMIAGYVAAALTNARLFESAQQAVRAKSAILDAVSHEFRTPITAILGFAELYREQVLGPVSEEQREAIDAMHRNGLRLLKLVDDLLDLARLEAGQMEMLFYPAEVRLCVNEAIEHLAASLRQKQLDLRLEIAEDLPLVHADAMWLRRVLVNLLSNAIRFTSAGAITVRAYTDERPKTNDQEVLMSGADGDGVVVGPASLVVVEIEDTGSGISAGELETIFEAFRRADDRSYLMPFGSSSGLGLAICKRAIDQMHGELTVRSRPGEGSIFSIRLRQAEFALEHAST